MQHLRLLLMLKKQGLDDDADLFHFHSLVRFYTVVCVLQEQEPIFLDHQDSEHEDTKQSH